MSGSSQFGAGYDYREKADGENCRRRSEEGGGPSFSVFVGFEIIFETGEAVRWPTEHFWPFIGKTWLDSLWGWGFLPI